jgi:hypothetical protein
MSKYYYAMAEKRGFDRAVLKILNVYDLFYSDAEIEPKTQQDKPSRKEKSEQELDNA